MSKEVKITFKIEGIEQEITNMDDFADAVKKATKETEDLDDATKDLGKSSEEASEASEGAMKVLDEATGGLATKVKEVGGGLKAMGKQAVTAFKGAVQGASAMGKALIATGIGAIVVALGLIVAYWDDIKGLVSGVSREQKDILAATEATRDAAADQLSITEEQENSLKLAGKSEREIRDIKIQQTDEVILATEALLEQQKQQKKAQVEAAERNQKITAGILGFLTLPITILLGAIDQLTKGLAYIGVLEEGTNLAEGYLMGASSFLFDPEEVAEEGDAVIEETEKTLRALKNKRDGFIIANQQEDQKAAEDRKAQRDKEAEDAERAAQEELARKKNIRDILKAAAKEQLDDAFANARQELQIQQDAAMEQLEALNASEEEKQALLASYAKKREKIAEDEAAYKIELEKQVQDANLDVLSQGLGAVQALLGENSKAAKAFAIAQTTVDTYVAAQKAYASQLIPGDPTSPVRAAIAAGVAVATGLANVRAILKTNPDGTGGTPSKPSVPTFNPRASINISGAAATNTVTPEAQTVVKAYVVSSDMTSQQEADKKINDLAKL